MQIGTILLNSTLQNKAEGGVQIASIEVSDVKDHKDVTALRAPANETFRTGSADKVVLLDMQFVGKEAINHELRHIIAQMFVSPVLPIRNPDITRITVPTGPYSMIYQNLSLSSGCDVKGYANTSTLSLKNQDNLYKVYAPLYVVENITLYSMPGTPNGIGSRVTLRLVDPFVFEQDGITKYLKTDIGLFKQSFNLFSLRSQLAKGSESNDVNGVMGLALWQTIMGKSISELYVNAAGLESDHANIDRIRPLNYSKSMRFEYTQDISLSAPFRRYYKYLLAPNTRTSAQSLDYDNTYIDPYEYNLRETNETKFNTGLYTDKPYEYIGSSNFDTNKDVTSLNKLATYDDTEDDNSIYVAFKSYSKLGMSYFDETHKELGRIIDIIKSFGITDIYKYIGYIAFLKSTDDFVFILENLKKSILSSNSKLRLELSNLITSKKAGASAKKVLKQLTNKATLKEIEKQFKELLDEVNAHKTNIDKATALLKRASASSVIDDPHEEANGLNIPANSAKYFALSSENGIVEIENTTAEEIQRETTGPFDSVISNTLYKEARAKLPSGAFTDRRYIRNGTDILSAIYDRTTITDGTIGDDNAIAIEKVFGEFPRINNKANTDNSIYNKLTGLAKTLSFLMSYYYQ
jgi:hypothetical protein